MKELEKLYEQNIDYSLRYLRAVEKTLTNDFSGKELGVEKNTDIITEIDGVLGRYTIDKVRVTKLFNEEHIIELHISKCNDKHKDQWVYSLNLFGDRLDFVYNRIIWE